MEKEWEEEREKGGERWTEERGRERGRGNVNRKGERIKRKGEGKTGEGSGGGKGEDKVQKEKAQVQLWLLHSEKPQFPALLHKRFTTGTGQTLVPTTGQWVTGCVREDRECIHDW